MNRYINFALRRPVTVLVILFIITLALIPGIGRLEFDNSVESFMPEHDSEYIYYKQVKKIYGDNGRFFIMAVSDKDLWDPETIKRINNIIIDLEEYKDFDRQREEDRLNRFDAVMAQGGMESTQLLGMFRDDPPFFRVLDRKIKKHIGGRDYLREKDLKKLRRELSRTFAFKERQVIDTILSPLTAKDITGEGDVLETYDLIEEDDAGNRILPATTEEVAAFREKLLRNPAFEKGIYARSPETGKITDFGIIVKFINLEDQDPTIREMMEIVDGHSDLHIVPTGVAVVNMWMNDYMHDDLFRNVPLVLLVVVIIFYFNFRSLRGVLLPLTTLGMAELWILGLMGYVGVKITGVGVALPPLMIAVGSSYAIHILNQYYTDFDIITAAGKQEGLRTTMFHISLTVLLAGITTFIAFMTLATSEVSAIREWGICSAVGVMFAVAISCSLIPAGLMLLPHKMPALMLTKDNKRKQTVIDSIIRLAVRGSTEHYYAVLIVVGVIVCISIVGMFRLKVETAFLTYFKEHDTIRVNTQIIGEKLGGGWGFNILINSGSPDGVKDPRLLNVVEELRQWLVAEENADLNIGRTDAFSDFIKTMHMAMNNDDRDRYRIPENRIDIVDYLELYGGDDDDSDGRYDEFEPFVDGTYQTTNILARLSRKQQEEVNTTIIKHIFAKIGDYLDSNLPAPFTYTLSGFPMMNVKFVYYVIKGQIQSLFLSLLVVGLIVMFLFQRLKAGPLALIPMSTAVIINFGIMGWFGIALDMATSVIAAITIGIGVDDTIHFLNTYRRNRALGHGVDETIARTLAVSGKAIIFTSLALIFGFSVLITSHFKPIILFGILTASTMINTTIGALLVLPSTIKATGINLTVREEKSWFWNMVNLDRFLGLEEYK
ncbi:MAG: MMPL family transporter [Deltaproteobacteria bacterium]|nr:MMPL family transporter [Deltaproteobacteria bacterium]